MEKPRVTQKMKETPLISQTKSSQQPLDGPPQIRMEGEKLQGQVGSYFITEEYNTSGGESDIYLCESEGTTYIAKIYRVPDESIDWDRRKQLVEFLLNVSQDSNIMPLIDYGQFGKRIFDILPWYEDGDLSTKGKFSADQLANQVIPAINNGLRTIHEHGMFHRDIKPANLFMHEDNLLIGDFGIASFAEGFAVATRSRRGTPGYTAPEVGNHVVTKKSDYFSLGITLASLYKGEEIFSGFSDLAIYSCILQKKLPVEFRAEDKRLTNLIDGLIAVDQGLRFGFEQVDQWCNGVDPIIPSSTAVTTAGWEAAYRFGDNECRNPVSLSISLAEEWDKAIEHLYRGYVSSFFANHDPEMAYVADNIIEKDCKTDRNLGLFRFLYHLNSDLPLCWQGKEYKDLADIAYQIKMNHETLKGDILSLFKSRALSWRLRQNVNMSEAQRGTLSQLEQLEELTLKGFGNISYDLFMYRFLAGEHKQSPTYKGQLIHNIDYMFAAVISKPAGFYNICKNLKADDNFLTAICFLGYQEAVLKLWAALGDSVLDNAALVLNFFESFVEDKIRVREFYCKYGPDGYLFWLKNNLNIYEFHGQAAKHVRNDFEKIELNSQMSIIELAGKFKNMESVCRRFMRLFSNNYFLDAAGFNKGAMAEGIVTIFIEGYFLYDFYGKAVPIGFGDFLKASEQVR